MFDRSDRDRALDIFRSAKRICCVCHRNPDGDAIGSVTGMMLLLQEQLPDAVIEAYCVDPSPPTFHFLPAAHRIRTDLQPRAGDAFIFVDCAEPHLTELHERFPELFDHASYPTVNFDHHPSNTNFAQINFVWPHAASTCEIVLAFADDAGWAVSPEAATSLLTGVYTDTGGLLHSNTTSSVYRTVARLLRCGARQQTIVKDVFRTAKVSTLRLWGRVLEKISLTEEGAAISGLTEGDFRATGADYSELTGAIDYVNAVPGMKFSLILAERQGKVKGSLRTMRDDVDVSALAAKFKGGGHKKAAGFALSGKLESEVRWKVK
jgi:bifunctional oligoribonuclease and PAP phosphatase NrnA